MPKSKSSLTEITKAHILNLQKLLILIFFAIKRVIHITKVKKFLHCQHRKMLYSFISYGQVCHGCIMDAVLMFSKGEGIVKTFY